MNILGKIELAHEPDFVLGRLTVSPSRRELVRDDGEREVIEHRVMQVLIALHRAEGGIVTRDELIMLCWNGRVVGEDAINRVISRLRKLANGIGASSIEIETITKIGYRLTGEDYRAAREGGSLARESAAVAVGSPAAHTTRRGLVIGAAAALAAAGGGAMLYRRITRPSVSPEVQALMVEADQALNQVTYEGQNQAMALYRRVIEMAPNFADGWGLLGFSYAVPSHFRPSVESEALRHRAEAAGRRALELEPGNANGELALAFAFPIVGHWRERERGLERALASDPDNYNARRSLAAHLYDVGRLGEALAQFGQIRVMRCPIGHHGLVAALWSAGRIEEAERAMEEAASLYPTHPALWLQRYELRAFGDRPATALAMVNDLEGRPTGFPDELIADFQASARAIQSRDPAATDAVMRIWMDYARQSIGFSVIAIRMASAFRRVDGAFDVADVYHLGRGFAGSTEQNSGSAGADIPLEQRGTGHLFEPVTRPMRADPRFAQLVEEIGLERYWRESGIQPDYKARHLIR